MSSRMTEYECVGNVIRITGLAGLYFARSVSVSFLLKQESRVRNAL